MKQNSLKLMGNTVSSRFRFGLKLTAFIAVIAAMSMFMAACNNDDDDEDDKEVKKEVDAEVDIEDKISNPRVAGLYIADAESPTAEAETGLAKNFEWIAENAIQDEVYHIVLDADEDSEPITLNSDAVNGATGVTIALEGIGGERIIYAAEDSPIFWIGEQGDEDLTGITLVLGDNITLDGKKNGGIYLVAMFSGKLSMTGTAKVTGSKETGVGVFGGEFNMSGGTISDNYGGESSAGVMVQDGTFIMSGGIISGNTGPAGSGVLVNYHDGLGLAVFKKIGGTIYGEDEGDNSNLATYTILENGNMKVAGHAVCLVDVEPVIEEFQGENGETGVAEYSKTIYYCRNTTAGDNIHFDSSIRTKELGNWEVIGEKNREKK